MARGRPLKYKTVAELEAAVKDYFKKCKGEILKNKNGAPRLNKFGEPIVLNAEPPTVTGLALHLGFTNRQSLLNYQGKKEFLDTITRAKSFCESYAESRLFDREGARGAEFSLRCNFRWNDKQSETENSNTIEDLLSLAELLKNG